MAGAISHYCWVANLILLILRLFRPKCCQKSSDLSELGFVWLFLGGTHFLSCYALSFLLFIWMSRRISASPVLSLGVLNFFRISMRFCWGFIYSLYPCFSQEAKAIKMTPLKQLLQDKVPETASAIFFSVFSTQTQHLSLLWHSGPAAVVDSGQCERLSSVTLHFWWNGQNACRAHWLHQALPGLLWAAGWGVLQTSHLHLPQVSSGFSGLLFCTLQAFTS